MSELITPSESLAENHSAANTRRLEDLLGFTLAVDPVLEARIDKRLNAKTMPRGALGRLMALAKQSALLQQTIPSPDQADPQAAILVFAADHGLAFEPISAYPRSVTWQMVENFLAGGAAINVMARTHHLHLRIVDAGVDHDFGPRSGLISAKLGYGSANCLYQAAMSVQQVTQALIAGAQCTDNLLELPGLQWIGFGEMGIGNTSIAALLLSQLLDEPVEQMAGRGTGVSDQQFEVKLQTLKAVLHRHASDLSRIHAQTSPSAILELAALLGGFEILMMSGAMLRAAQQRKMVVVDGFISTAAAVLAVKLNPASRSAMVFSHLSAEAGHRRALSHLKAEALLDLGLRLGEGSAAALAMPLIKTAWALLRDMASFESAQVSDRIMP